MSRASSSMRDFAKRLIAYEALTSKSSAARPPAAFHVAERLRPHLTALMGSGGYRAVALRALTLAQEEVPWLRAIQVGGDGSLEGLEKLHAELDPNTYVEVRIVLLAHLLGLLVAFIGFNLTLHLVREVWPNAPLDNLDPDTGDKK